MKWCSFTCVQPWIPSWFSPTHITRPLPSTSSGLGMCPDQISMLLSTQLTLLSTQLTLLLQPFTDTPPPPPAHTHTHSGSSSRSTDKQDSLLSAPLSLSSLSPHPLGVQLCWLCGVLSHPCLSVHTGPSVQRKRTVSQGTEGRWKTGPAVPSSSSRGRPCPLSSHSPKWVHLTIYESPCHP